MRYSELRRRQKNGVLAGIVGLVLIMTREPALHLASRGGPASQGTASLVLGLFGPVLVVLGIVYFIRGRGDPPAR